ncbi:tail assembly protein [Cupriavidus yeoncheonensis]
MLREVRLYGHLARRFGRHHRFAVGSPAEAIRALMANFPDFENHLIEHSQPGYRVLVGKRDQDMQGLTQEVWGAAPIRIVPVVAGAGRGGLQILIGAALIAATFYTGGGTLSGMTGLMHESIAASMAVAMGTGLVAGGVAQMLTKPPAITSTERPENRPSYAFNGAVNTTQQGNSVPVCYGELIVGSQVVYAGITTDEIPVDGDPEATAPATGSVAI